MTAEYRGLRAEEAYLQQELDKLHELRNKVKMEGEAWDEVVSSSSQNSHLVQRATRLWDSLLSCKSQHEVLASGPIEDLIAHREHRYRISGSSLLAAMDESSQVDLQDKKEQVKENVKENTVVDIAEVIRRWTHALQHIHKHSLYLAKANEGEGPDILRSTSGHAESLATTLAQHRQHLASLQVLVNQLKDVGPTIQNSISELSQELNFPQMTNRSTSPVPRKMVFIYFFVGIYEKHTFDVQESSSDYKVSSALKLAPLFSLTSAKSGNFYKRHTNVSEQTQVNTQAQTDDYVCDMKKCVREARRSSNNNMGGQKQTSTANKQLFESQSVYTCSNLDATNSAAASSSYAESFDDHVFSPPFLIEPSDSFEDLLAPLSESERALMEH